MAIRIEDVDKVDLGDVVDETAEPLGPVHPGEILQTEFLDPLGMSLYRLAKALDVPLTRLAAIVRGRRGVTADTALRLGRAFGTGPEFWIRLQGRYDLAVARQKSEREIEERVRVLA